MRVTDDFDPKGLIHEAFVIDGISASECRTIFLDWALSLGDISTDRAVPALLSRHQAAPLGHPMTQVLKDALEHAPQKRRRGGRAGRLGAEGT